MSPSSIIKRATASNYRGHNPNTSHRGNQGTTRHIEQQKFSSSRTAFIVSWYDFVHVQSIAKGATSKPSTTFRLWQKGLHGDSSYQKTLPNKTPAADIMVNFLEKEHKTLRYVTSTSLLPLLSLVLDKPTVQPHYKTPFLNSVLK